MNVLDLRNGHLAAFFRSRWADNIYASRSPDGGRTWTEPAPTELPNNNSPIQAARLADGHLAMVYNHSSAADATDRRLSLYDAPGEEGDPAPAAPPSTPGGGGGGRSAFWGAPRAPMTLAIS